MRVLGLRFLTCVFLLGVFTAIWFFYQRPGMIIFTSLVTVGLLWEYQKLALRSISSVPYRACFFIICFLFYLMFVLFPDEWEWFILSVCLLFIISFWFLSMQKKIIHIVYGIGLAIIGIFYIVIPVSLFLRSFIYFKNGPHFIVLSLLIIFSGDVIAYVVGSFFGGKKWMAHISPSKTWSGLLGGFTASGLITGVGLKLADPMGFVISFLIGAFFFFVAQTGDLFVSILKRREGVKNTGSILPGHGGLLDRLDGFLLSFPLMYVLALKFSFLY